MSVMAAYNSWDGVPCTCNEKLLTDILRNEWGFKGFVVSDYNSVEGVWEAHRLFDTEWKAQAASLKAGLDVDLPQNSYDDLMIAYKEGWIDESDIDRALLRVLTAKFSIGLMDKPFADRNEAQSLVRCDEHKQLALEAARRSMVLLKNEGVLPFNKKKMKKLAVFGMGADVFPVGKNYSGPYGKEWTAEDAKTPLQVLREYLDGYAEVIFADDDRIEEVAAKCDAAIYMTTVVEGEGMDRSDIRLPAYTRKAQKDDSAIIVGKFVGDNALSAVGSAAPILNLLLALFVGVSTGAGIVVSQYYGAGAREKLSRAVGNCITLGFIATVATMVIGVLIARPMLTLLDTPVTIYEWCADYLTLYFLGAIGFTFYNILSGILRGLGDSVSALR